MKPIGKKILVIEADEQLAHLLARELGYEGYSVTVCHDGRSGLETAKSQQWDLILLNLVLPELGGFEVARRISSKTQNPFMIMSTRDATMDKVASLDSGAEDFIVIPFSIAELLARIRAYFRGRQRSEQKNQKFIEGNVFRDLHINHRTRQVYRREEIINLSKRELELLLILFKNIGRAVSREEIVQHLWGTDAKNKVSIVDAYIRYLRKRLDQDGVPSYVKTVRGVGYMLGQG